MKTLIYALILAVLVITGCTNTADTAATTPSTQSIQSTTVHTTEASTTTTAISDQPSFTQGLATTINPGLLQCKEGRESALGEIKSDDGKTWIVPTDVNTKLADASDMSNGCNNVHAQSIADVNLDKVPLTVIDADGVEITAYIFADNYFELYANGKAVAKDPVPFTPFNSSVVRFKAKYPITYAIKVVDWEENLGLGSEDNKGNKYHPGDAGIVISFSDGTVTDESWKAQNYYMAPLASKSDLVVEEKAGKVVRSTVNASNEPKCEDKCYAAHFTVPENWFAVSFDDSTWPAATTYEERTVGVDNKSEYTNFASEFRKGKFIWTNNLNLDNEILLRHTVDKAEN